FDVADRNKLIRQVTQGEPPRLDRVNPAVPRDLVTIVHKAADRDPARRYQSAGDLSADLRRFLADEPIKARRTSSLERLGRWARRNPGVAASLAVIAVLLAGVAVASTVAAWRFERLAGEKETARVAAEESRQAAEEAADERVIDDGDEQERQERRQD